MKQLPDTHKLAHHAPAIHIKKNYTRFLKLERALSSSILPVEIVFKSLPVVQPNIPSNPPSYQ